jgi:dihydroorotase
LIFRPIQPNLVPPIKTTEQALEYKQELEKIDPDVEYLMTLYLSPDLTPEEIYKAHKAGIIGTEYLIFRHNLPHIQL